MKIRSKICQRRIRILLQERKFFFESDTEEATINSGVSEGEHQGQVSVTGIAVEERQADGDVFL